MLNTVDTQEKKTPSKKNYGALFSDLAPYIGLAAVIVIFQLLTNEALLTVDNLQSLSNQVIITAMVTIGAVFVFGMDCFDMSLGSGVLMGSVLGGMAAIATGNLFLAFLVCMAVPLVMGLLKGIFASFVEVPFFIFTIVLSTVISAVVLVILGNETTIYLKDAVNPIPAYSFTEMTAINVVVLLAYFLFCLVLFNFSGVGIRTKMLGGSFFAAKQSGINLTKTKITGFLISAVGIGLAACGSTGQEASDSAKGSGATERDAGDTKDTGDTKKDEKDSAGSEEEKKDDTAGSFALDGSWPEETVKIGVEVYDVTDEQFLAMQTYYEDMTNYFNIEFMYSESIASAEDELKFVENCASAGCKAVIGYYNITEAEAAQLCADKGMYYWGSADKTSVYDSLGSSEYYLGSYDNGDSDFEMGYSMGQALLDQGAKKIVYVSGGDEMGVEMFIKRYEGFKKAIEESQGAEIIRKVPGWPGTDAFTAEQTAVCDMEFDALASAFSAAVWFQPLAGAGKLDGSIKMATVGNVSDVYYDAMNEGTVSAIMYDCEEVLFGSAIPMILNAVSGHMDANRNDKGTAANFAAPRWTIDSAEIYNAIFDLHEDGKWFVTAEDIADCLVEYNKDADYSTLVDTYGSMDIDTALKKIQ